MPGLKASTTQSGTPNETAAKEKKGKSTKKFLSNEFVGDSDSDGGIEEKSRTPKASAKASIPSKSKSKDIVMLSATASKSNGGSKAVNVDQSAKKNLGGSRDTKVNGNKPQSVIQPDSTPSQKSESFSIQAIGRHVTAAGKHGARPVSTPKADHPTGRTQQKGVENQSDSDDGDEETDDGSSDSTGSEGDITREIAAQSPLRSHSSSSKVTIPKVPAPKQKLASLESSESPTSDESSSDDEMSPKVDKVNCAKQPQTPSKPTAAVYKPPAGFSSASISHPEASDVPNLFSPTNLASKQIWHVILPAAIPISAIKDIPMDKILRGGPALAYNGSEFGFLSNAETMQNRKHVLFPDSEHNDYRAAPKAITRSLRLQQILNLPSLGKAAKDNASGPNAQRHVRGVVHEQPSGLKMRYVPFGDESGTHGLGTSSDEEGEVQPAAAVFRMPPSPGNARQQSQRDINSANDMEDTLPDRTSPDPLTLGRSPKLKGSPKKRRMEEVKNDLVPETPPKKRRKKHRRDEVDEADVVQETPVKTKLTDERLSHADIDDRDGLEAEVPSKNGMTEQHEKETLEDKSKRRAERKQRNEEHRKRKEERERKKAESASVPAEI